MQADVRLTLFAIVLSALSISYPFLLGSSIDFLSSGDEFAVYAIFATCLCIFVTPCFKLGNNLYLQKLAANTRLSLKRRLLYTITNKHLSRLANGGEVIELVDGDVDGALYLFHNAYYDCVVSASIILMSLCVIFFYHPLILLAPAAAITLSACLYYVVRKRACALFDTYVTEHTSLIGQICDEIRFKVPYEFAAHQGRVQSVKTLFVSASLRSSSLDALSGSSYIVGVVVLLVLGEGLVSGGEITVGEFFSSVVYVERVLAPVGALMSIYFSTRESAVRFQRITRNLCE